MTSPALGTPPAAVLPAGFALPPAPYLVALLVGVAAVGYAFYRRRPAVTERRILGLAPWMATGSACHVLYGGETLPTVLRPFAGTPAVYVTVAVVAGAAWLLADAADLPVAATLGTTGTLAFLVAAGWTLAAGAASGSLSPTVPALGLGVASVVAAATWAALRRVAPDVGVTGRVGALAVFGHALDAVSTAVGVDLLGFGERTPLSRLILDVGAALPVAEYVGSAWLFVLVKLAVAAFVVVLLADYVREEPDEGYLLLGLVAAVGLGPGVHNLLLFTVAG
jgi:uncharacterized membrane protein